MSLLSRVFSNDIDVSGTKEMAGFVRAWSQSASCPTPAAGHIKALRLARANNATQHASYLLDCTLWRSSRSRGTLLGIQLMCSVQHVCWGHIRRGMLVAWCMPSAVHKLRAVVEAVPETGYS